MQIHHGCSMSSKFQKSHPKSVRLASSQIMRMPYWLQSERIPANVRTELVAQRLHQNQYLTLTQTYGWIPWTSCHLVNGIMTSLPAAVFSRHAASPIINMIICPSFAQRVSSSTLIWSHQFTQLWMTWPKHGTYQCQICFSGGYSIATPT